jgi:hypothetical protein
VSERPVDFFVAVPLRFVYAHDADEIDWMHFVIGVHVAAQCFEVRNTSDSVAAIRLSTLAELCGNVTDQTIRNKLHDLKPAWIDFDVRQGQRSAWRIRLTGLAQETETTTPLPSDFKPTSNETTPFVLKLTSNDSEPDDVAIPHGERARTSTRLQNSDSEVLDKRNETKRNEDERKASTRGNLDHLGVETTVAGDDLADALERARLFDERFPPPPRRAS